MWSEKPEFWSGFSGTFEMLSIEILSKLQFLKKSPSNFQKFPLNPLELLKNRCNALSRTLNNVAVSKRTYKSNRQHSLTTPSNESTFFSPRKAEKKSIRKTPALKIEITKHTEKENLQSINFCQQSQD